jgi:hypothetical protein
VAKPREAIDDDWLSYTPKFAGIVWYEVRCPWYPKIQIAECDDEYCDYGGGEWYEYNIFSA